MRQPSQKVYIKNLTMYEHYETLQCILARKLFLHPSKQIYFITLPIQGEKYSGEIHQYSALEL